MKNFFRGLRSSIRGKVAMLDPQSMAIALRTTFVVEAEHEEFKEEQMASRAKRSNPHFTLRRDKGKRMAFPGQLCLPKEIRSGALLAGNWVTLGGIVSGSNNNDNHHQGRHPSNSNSRDNSNKVTTSTPTDRSGPTICSEQGGGSR